MKICRGEPARLVFPWRRPCWNEKCSGCQQKFRGAYLSAMTIAGRPGSMWKSQWYCFWCTPLCQLNYDVHENELDHLQISNLIGQTTKWLKQRIGISFRHEKFFAVERQWWLNKLLCADRRHHFLFCESPPCSRCRAVSCSTAGRDDEPITSFSPLKSINHLITKASLPLKESSVPL